MTFSVVLMIIIGIILIIVSFFVTEKLTKKERDFNIDLITVDDDYEFSERELHIIKRKIEDVIAKQAKDILYETNESLSAMANEKTMALGDYAVAVCEEIEKNHKEVMFLYSMLDDKQKEIMNTVKAVDDVNREVKENMSKLEEQKKTVVEHRKTVTEQKKMPEVKEEPKRQSAIDQLTALKQMKENLQQDQGFSTMAETDNRKSETENISMEGKDKIQGAHMESGIETDFNEETVSYIEGSGPEMGENASVEETEEISLDEMLDGIDQADVDFNEVMEEEFEENENCNDIILELYRNGESIIEIAKQLGLGVGEVKLVIDLYQGE